MMQPDHERQYADRHGRDDHGPVPKEWFAGKKRIAVIDRDISLGFGGILWGEIRGLADADAVVQNYVAGIGGGDVRPRQIVAMLADLQPRRVSGPPAMMEAV